MTSVQRGAEIARGKTKVLYACVGEPDNAVVEQMDAITAGDGTRRDVIEGKGRLAALTTSRVFRFLTSCGVPTHYVRGGEDADHNAMVVRRCTMIPLEVVTRGAVAGTYAKRHPELARGSPLVPRVIEFFFKDDARHDPMISVEDIVAGGIATPVEIDRMSEIARATFELLADAWKKRGVTLVDLKVEFGRIVSGESAGELVLADVVDNDAWRIWPNGDEARMLDKQLYRNLERRDDEGLARVKRAYEEVAAAVADFRVP